MYSKIKHEEPAMNQESTPQNPNADQGRQLDSLKNLTGVIYLLQALAFVLGGITVHDADELLRVVGEGGSGYFFGRWAEKVAIIKDRSHE